MGPTREANPYVRFSLARLLPTVLRLHSQVVLARTNCALVDDFAVLLAQPTVTRCSRSSGTILIGIVTLLGLQRHLWTYAIPGFALPRALPPALWPVRRLAYAA